MNLQEVTQQISDRVSKEEQSLGATLKFVIPDHGIVYLDGNSDAVSNDDSDADCVVTVAMEDLEAMLGGSLNPAMAFMGGKLQVEGDMSVAMKVQNVVG